MIVTLKKKELLQALEEIGHATSNLFRLEPVLDKFCRQIQHKFGYDFVAVQLVRPDEPVIESAYGRGIASEWAYLVKHPFNSKRELRDIQADIVYTYSTEVIAGWDDRFDKWVYETYGHDKLVRVFTPMLIVTDGTSGEIAINWIDQFPLQEDKTQYFRGADQINCIGTRKAFTLPIDNIIANDFYVTPIGSVEVGFRLNSVEDFKQAINKITARSVLDLIRFVCVESTNIKNHLLPYVLKKTVQNAVKVIGSDSASIHFDYNPNIQKYAYQVCAGKIDNRFLDLHPPRPAPHGLGRKGIRDNQPKFVPNASESHNVFELKNIIPNISHAGVTAIAAFPLIVDDDEGVLYIHYHNAPHWWTDEEIEIGKAFSTLAVNAVRNSNSYTKTRNYLRQFIALHSITQTLSSVPDEKELIKQISFSLLNLMAADMVTIWEYFEAKKKRFSSKPYIAGKLINKSLAEKKVATNSALDQFAAKGKNYYAEAPVDDLLLYQDGELEKNRYSIMYAEGIKSTAGILLMVGSEVVGVVLAHFRRNKRFSKQEKSIMQTFSSIAAMSLKNLRLLQSVASLEFINQDCKQILDEIIRRAVLVTGANMGSIRRVDSTKKETVVLAIYPTNSEVNEAYKRMHIEDGITGQAIKSKQPIIVNNVAENENFRAFFRNTGSELCFPIIDRNTVIGAINIDSQRQKAFSPRDVQVMNSLANQAVIAMNFCSTESMYFEPEF